MFFCSMIHFSSDQMSVEELTEAMQSSASGEEKTSFLIEYLLSQREGILDFAKTQIGRAHV